MAQRPTPGAARRRTRTGEASRAGTRPSSALAAGVFALAVVGIAVAGWANRERIATPVPTPVPEEQQQTEPARQPFDDVPDEVRPGERKGASSRRRRG